MSFIDVVKECKRLQIKLSEKGGKLVVSDAHSNLNEQLTAQLREHKVDILKWLTSMPAVSIKPRPEGEGSPLTHSQRRLFFVDQLEGGSLQYNIPVVLRFTGALNLDAIGLAATAIVQRHEVLRTCYELRDGEPRQRLLEVDQFPVTSIDLTRNEPDGIDSMLQRIAEDELSTPFDLQRDLMMRVTIVDLPDSQHAVLLTIHHIAADGWSISVLVREFMQLYNAGEGESNRVLPPLKLQYADYAYWQSQQLTGDRLKQKLAFWRDQLEGAPPIHGLPLDYIRPAKQDYAAGHTKVLVDKELLDTLKQLANQAETTLFTVLQTAFAVVLGRWSDSTDIVLGVPVAGRDKPEIEDLIGFFINTLVVRTTWDSAESFTRLLKRRKEDVIQLFSNQDMPFELLVEELNPRRDLSYNPVCQIKFVLQNYEEKNLEISDVDIEALDLTEDSIRFDLDLTCYQANDSLQLSLTYKKSLFASSTIDSMAESLLSFLTTIAQTPDCPLSQVALVGADTRRQLETNGNGAQYAVEHHETFLPAFRSQVERCEGHVALADGQGRSMDYRTLNDYSWRLSQFLIDQGCERGDRIALLFDQSIDLMVALVGVLRAGCAYIPLEPGSSSARVDRILNTSDAEFVILSKSMLERASVSGIDVFVMDNVVEDERWLEEYSQPEQEQRDLDVEPDDPAYVIYTSGSTGTPKGVLISHGSLNDYLSFANRTYYQDGLAGSCLVTSHGFDISVPALLLPLMRGGSVQLLPADEVIPNLLTHLLSSNERRLLRMTPNHAQALCWYMEEDSVVESAHVFVVGGESFKPEVLAELKQKFPQSDIYNHYGPSEATVGCTLYHCDRGSTASSRSVPIGRPMDNVVLRVLDEFGNLAPQGAPGELYVGGPCLATEYLLQPELTEAQFPTIRVDGAPKQRFYRTGDVVRWRSDEELEYIGRADFQFKLRGYRIEPGEIEHQILQHDAIESTVVVLDGSDRLASIVAYFVPQSVERGVELDTDAIARQIREQLKRNLPAYMVPKHLISLERLPLTQSGKIDRAALPSIDPVDTNEHVEASTPTETVVATIWRDVLDAPALSVTDDFFALGGHSLLAMQIISQIGKQLGKTVVVRALFEHPTVRSLSSYLESLEATGQETIAPVNHDEALPLSFAQQRLWVIDRLEGDTRQYNMPIALKIEGELQIDALQRAVDTLVDRHKILRTAIVEVEGTGMQRVHEALSVPITHRALSDGEPSDVDELIVSLAEQEANLPFDLSQPLKVRCQLLQQSARSHVLLFTLHHIACDGLSINILIRETSQLYDAYCQGKQSPLQALGIQYADFASWQRRTVGNARSVAQLDYWLDHLADIPTVHSLPLDFVRPARQNFRAGRIPRMVKKATLERLRTLCQQQSVTLFMLLESAFALVIERWSKADDVVIGIPTAGRSNNELNDLIGFFVNTLVIRNDLSGDPTFGELLQRNREVILDAYTNADTPFERLVEELSPERNLAVNPLVQIKFALQTFENEVVDLNQLTLSSVDHDVEFIRFDLDLSATENKDSIHLNWGYKKELFAPETVEAIADSLSTLLEHLAESHDVPISQLNVLSPGDIERLSAIGQGSSMPVESSDGLLCSLMAKADAQPSRIALASSDGVTISYADLLVYIDRLAASLVDQGYGASDRIGVLFERDVDVIVAMLGVLRMGGAYVPLEPSNTAERLKAIIADADIELVIAASEMVPLLSVEGIDVLVLDACSSTDGWMEEYANDSTDLVAEPDDESEAYTIFTSGSTGRPKGVAISHASLNDYLNYACRHYYQPHLHGSLVVTSHGFDITVPALFLPLLAGGTVTMVSGDDAIVRLYEMLTAENCPAYLMRMTPNHVKALVLLFEQPLSVPARHVFVIGGESFPAALAEQLQSLFPNSTVYNHYGPTEATVGCCIHEVAGVSPASTTLPIGRPMANVDIRILDDRQQWVPKGAVGEIHIGGPGLAIGYLNNEEETERRFVVIEQPNGETSRFYRTGDLGRWLPSDELQFLGRNDHQVKLRGYRLEPGEIEACLLKHPVVSSAVVTKCVVHGTEHLVAYLVLGAERSSEEELRTQLVQHLRSHLPAYMVPEYFQFLDALPLSASGKVQRKRLPPVSEQRQNDRVLPRNETERLLAEIWADVLNRKAVGVYDNFFALGGDSIYSIQMVARANRQGLALSARQLFEHQTIADLAPLCTRTETKKTSDAPVTGELKPLLAHHRFMQSNRVDIDHYNQSMLIPVDAGIDSSALLEIVTALYHRHDALRLKCEVKSDSWRFHYDSVNQEQIGASVACEQLPNSTSGHKAFLEERCGFWQTQLSVSHGPLFRMVYFDGDAANATPEDEESGSSSYLFAVFHHFVMDGVSWRIVLADLAKAVECIASGQPVKLDSKSSSLQDWTEALDTFASDESVLAERSFWSAQRPTEPVALPLDVAHVDACTYATSASEHFQLSEQRTRQLLEQCHTAYRTQTPELLLSALYIALRDWTGSHEQLIELEGHGREDLFPELDLSETVGWFTTHFPLLLTTSDQTLAEVIMCVKDQYRSIPRHGIGYGVLRYLSNDQEFAEQENDRSIDIVFNYLGQFGEAQKNQQSSQGDEKSRRSTGVDVGAEISPERQRVHKLGVKAIVAGGALSVTTDYSTREFNASTIVAFRDRYQQALEAVIDHCLQDDVGQYTVSDFSLAKISRQKISRLQSEYPDMCDLYAATPMQQGMLFHTLLDRANYVMQTCPTFHGELNCRALEQAWQYVVCRHEVFRSAFDENEGSAQVVVSETAKLPFVEIDWRHLSEREQDDGIADFIKKDRKQGFDLNCAPLMRITLFKLGEDKHQMIWTHHHLLSDGWSSALIYADVMRAYQAYLRSEDPVVPEPPRYKEYVAWLSRQSIQAANDHWSQILANHTSSTQMNLDRLPAADQGGYSDRSVSLSVAESNALRQVAKHYKCTVNTLLQLAWGLLLRRYSGDQQVVFGITTSGRPTDLANAESMVGLFINTIPVRIDFTVEGGIGRLVERIQSEAQASMEYAYLPLSDIQKQSGVPFPEALFDTLLVFENYPIDEAIEASSSGESEGALRVEAEPGEIRTHYDLSLSAYLGDVLDIRCGFRQEQFHPATIERVLGHLTQILKQLPNAQSLEQIDLISEPERQQLDSWNALSHAYPVEATVERQFAAWAEQDPDALAVTDTDRSLSYGELDRKAERLAHVLLASKVRKNDRIGLCCERSVDVIVGILAIMKAGAVYVPIDPEYPRARIEHMLEDSGTRVVVTQTSVLERLPILAPYALTLDNLPSDTTLEVARVCEPVEVERADPAYLIYTSGSSGTPKGVLLSHQGALNLACNQRRLLQVKGHSRVLQFASLSFDAATWDWMMALTAGASLHICDQSTRLSPEKLGVFLCEQSITHATLPPSLLAYLSIDLDYSLERLVIAGEACDPALARKWAARVALINAYGPTENTVCATLGRVQPDEPLSIGTPLANVQTYVIGSNREELPVGVVGELCIGGDSLALAYHGQPELTAERFVFLPSVNQRVYLTGDLVQRLDDGSFLFVGRKDDQVKIRGFRVEPGEIEQHLCTLDGVREAAVVAVTAGTNVSLAAYVVVDDASHLQQQPHTLRSLLAERVPDYLVPASLQLMGRLPLTENGKLDRNALPEPDFSSAEGAFETPEGSFEVELASLWAAVLDLPSEKVSALGNFFELGGHSLLVVKLHTAIRAEFGFDLPLDSLFQRQTLRQMASVIENYSLLASDSSVDQSDGEDLTVIEEIY